MKLPQDLSTPLGTPHNTGERGQKRRRESSSSTLSATTPPSLSWWVANLRLLQEDELLLDGGDLLNDRLMDAVNQLVTSQLGGLANQSTLLAQGTGGFTRVQIQTASLAQFETASDA